MLNMIFNTILRCDKNGLRPLNAISLARVTGFAIAWLFVTNLTVFGNDNIKQPKCDDDTNAVVQDTGKNERLVENNQNIKLKNVMIPFSKKHRYVIAESSPAFCLDVTLLVDTVYLDHNRFCYKRVLANSMSGTGGAGRSKSEMRNYNGYSAGVIFTNTESSENEAEIEIQQFVHKSDSTQTITTKFISSKIGMRVKSDILSPLKMEYVMLKCGNGRNCLNGF